MIGEYPVEIINASRRQREHAADNVELHLESLTCAVGVRPVYDHAASRCRPLGSSGSARPRVAVPGHVHNCRRPVPAARKKE